MQASQYDYIFLGAGCASLSIIMRMINSKKFIDKKILIIDKESKTKNDRTWCFWEKEVGFFEEIIYRKWNHLFFKTDDESIPLNIYPYQYKMIRAIDFYGYCFQCIILQENIHFIYGNISFGEDRTALKIKIDDELLLVNNNVIIFNSIYEAAPEQKDKFYLLQHFKGWIVESQVDYFKPDQAVLMDFRVSQEHGTTFVYVLPISSTKALVEYTLFTKNLLAAAEYNIALENYIKNYLNIENYKIVDEEFGVIPMTNATFPRYENGMYYVGTAGGQTKASTGYTFRFIQKQADSIVKKLIATNRVSKEANIKNRFYFYDTTLLHILSKQLLDGKTIFSTLFKKNKATTVLKFLDNETKISEEIKLISSLPKKIFVKAGFKEFLKMSFQNFRRT
ncbi:MAG: lycopene cyclase family protein [Ginsengibacter sp.]